MIDQDTEPTFITEEPDWKFGFTFSQKWANVSNDNRIGGSQRIRFGKSPEMSIDYQLGSLDAKDIATRMASSQINLRAPVVCPIWTIKLNAIATVSVTFEGQHANVITFDSNLGVFPRTYLYKVSSKKFYKILKLSGNEITVGAEPGEIIDITDSEFIPTVFGRRVGVKFTHQTLDNIDERISITSL